MLISVIIVNYNSGQCLRKCTSSILAYSLPVEIIVVDNASTDESLDTLDMADPVTIIRNDKNLGFSAGCNIGFKVATAKYILFLNPDCVLLPGTTSQLLNYLQNHKQVGMVGGLLVNPDGTEQLGGRRLVPTPWRTFVRTFGLMGFARRWPRFFEDFNLHKQSLPADPIEVEAISGACMLVKREVIDDVGLWDEGYFLHCEDLDWCMRFREHGWTIVFVPAAKIVHEQGACSASRPIFVEWHKHKGMMRFYRKFFRHQYPDTLMWLVALGVWLRFSSVVAIKSLRRLTK